MTKIYVGNLPFGRADETPQTVVSPSPRRQVYEGKLNEGVPSSVLPQDLRRQLDSGQEVALAEIRDVVKNGF